MRSKRTLTIIITCTLLSIYGFIYENKSNTDLQISFKVDTLATNLKVPWQITFLPDRSILFTDRTGFIRILRKGKLVSKSALSIIDVNAETKTGLLGMAIHPDFYKNHYVFIAYNNVYKGLIRLKVIRYELNSDTLINSKIIIDSIPGNRNHTGCRLVLLRMVS